MKSKEKAMELVEKYENIVPMIDGYYSYEKMIEEHFNKSKQCALIAVDEILKVIHTNMEDKYWQEVKQEINLL